MHDEAAIWAGIPDSIQGFMFRESGRVPFSDSQSAVAYLSEVWELSHNDDAPRWFTGTVEDHNLKVHFMFAGGVAFRGAQTLANNVKKDLDKKYKRAIKRGQKAWEERLEDPETIRRLLIAFGHTPEVADAALAASKPVQRTPSAHLESAVQQALLIGDVNQQAETVLAWKFKIDGEGPWTLRDIVKDNDLDPDVLAGWLPELVEACPKVGDTYLLGGGAAAITTWERVSQRVRDAAPR